MIGFTVHILRKTEMTTAMKPYGQRVSFYRATVSSGYVNELLSGLPVKRAFILETFPTNDAREFGGLDLLEVKSRQAVMETLNSIRLHLLYVA
jgi:hypothetical protein